MRWRRGQTAILTQVLLAIAHFFLILAGIAKPWVTEGPKPSVYRWLSLRHIFPNWLKPSGHLVILLFNVHLLPLFFRLFTQVHLLIDCSVEGKYITISKGIYLKTKYLLKFICISINSAYLELLYEKKDLKLTKNLCLDAIQISHEKNSVFSAWTEVSH